MELSHLTVDSRLKITHIARPAEDPHVLQPHAPRSSTRERTSPGLGTTNPVLLCPSKQSKENSMPYTRATRNISQETAECVYLRPQCSVLTHALHPRTSRR